MIFNIACRMNPDGKRLDVIFAKLYGVRFGKEERKRYILVTFDMEPEQAATMSQLYNGKPRFQLAMKTLKQAIPVNKRKVADKTVEYQPFEEELKQGFFSRLFRRKYKKVLTFNDLIDRSKA